MADLLFPELSSIIVDSFYKVHRTLGAGFLEKVYENAMMIELRSRGVSCEQQRPISVFYEGQVVGQYFADILVDEKVILELKAAERMTDMFSAQILNYLRATELRLGFVLNYGPKAEFLRRVI